MMRKHLRLLGYLFSMICLVGSSTSEARFAEKEAYDPPIVPRSEWGARPPSGEYTRHIPDRLTIHHTAGAYTNNQDSAGVMRSIQKTHMNGRGWEDIAYHYLIAPDGVIYEGRPVWAVGDTATDYDPTNHLLVCVMGNFEVQEPTREQLDTLEKFIVWLSIKYKIDPATIAGHRDYTSTLCPGKNLYKIIRTDEYKKNIRMLMNTPLLE